MKRSSTPGWDAADVPFKQAQPLSAQHAAGVAARHARQGRAAAVGGASSTNRVHERSRAHMTDMTGPPCLKWVLKRAEFVPELPLWHKPDRAADRASGYNKWSWKPGGAANYVA